MKNKKGFTLSEILGVIVIIGMLLVVVTPPILNRIRGSKDDAKDAGNKIIYDAALQHINENKEYYPAGKRYCIKIKTLIDEGKLVSPVKDVTTGKTLDENFSILVSVYSAGNMYYEISKDDECKIMESLPLITFTIDPNGTNWVKKRRVTIHFNEGSQSREYSLDAGQTWYSYNNEILPLYAPLTLYARETIKGTVNISKIDIKYIDSEVPQITSVKQSDDSNYKLTIKVKDDYSGVGWYSLKDTKPTEEDDTWVKIPNYINNGTITTPKGKTTIAKDTIQIPQTYGQTYTQKIWIKDQAGNINEDKSLTIERKEYKVAFNKNGTDAEGTMQTVTYERGKEYTLPENQFTRVGYTYQGWSESTTGNKIYNNKEKVKNLIASGQTKTLYAKWSINTYQITYNYSENGGTTATKSTANVNYNSAVDLTPTATKSGYTFVGWNTDKDATTKLSSYNMPARNVTLYAIYRKEAKTITITFDKNGAKNQTNSSGSKVTDNTVTRSCTIAAVYNKNTQATTCNITSPAIEGSTNTPTVIGYSTAANTHTSSWNQNTSKDVSANATYYAQTKKDAKTVSVTFSKGTNTSSIGKTSDSCTIAIVYNGTSQATTCTISTPTITAKSGYTALGWSTTKDASSGTKAGNNITVSSTTTYYGNSYKPAITRRVTFAKGTNTSSIGKTSDSCTISAVYGSGTQGTSCSVTLPSITSKSGYTSAGWSTTKDATSGKAAGATISLSSDATYYGNSKASCTVTGWQCKYVSGVKCKIPGGGANLTCGYRTEAYIHLCTDACGSTYYSNMNFSTWKYRDDASGKGNYSYVCDTSSFGLTVVTSSEWQCSNAGLDSV